MKNSSKIYLGMIDLCGGSETVRLKCGVSVSSLISWCYRGFPLKHWSVIKKLSKNKITSEQLYQFNQLAKRENDKK